MVDASTALLASRSRRPQEIKEKIVIKNPGHPVRQAATKAAQKTRNVVFRDSALEKLHTKETQLLEAVNNSVKAYNAEKKVAESLNQRMHPEKEEKFLEEYHQLRHELDTTRSSIKDKTKGNSVSMAKHLGLASAGAIGGALVASLRGIKNTGQSVGSAVKEHHENGGIWVFLHTFFFFVFAFIIIRYEFLGGGYASGTPTQLRLYYSFFFMTLMTAFFLITREKSLMYAAWFAGIYTILFPWFFSRIANFSVIGVDFGGGLIGLFYGLAAPGILWFYVFANPYFSSIPKNIMLIALVVLVFLTMLPYFNSLNLTGDDTGFSPQKWTSSFAETYFGQKSPIKNIACAFNPNCGFQRWWDSLIDPFREDVTAIDQLQNANLGVFISDTINGDKEVKVYGNSTIGLHPITFRLLAPHPDLGFDLCELEGTYSELCGHEVNIECSGEDLDVEVFDDSTYKYGELFAGRSTPIVCNIKNVEHLGTKELQFKASYTYISATAHRINTCYAEVCQKLDDSEKQKFIDNEIRISSGGPVIIESNENELIAIDTTADSRLNRFPMIITLAANFDSRLDAINNLEVYLPSGTTLEGEQPVESICKFKDNGSNVFTLEQSALDELNRILDNTDVDDANNEITFSCLVHVTDASALISSPENPITHRLINIFAEYKVSTWKTTSVKVTGILSDFGYFGGADNYNFGQFSSNEFDKYIEQVSESNTNVGIILERIKIAANRNSVPPQLLLAICMVESANCHHWKADGSVVKNINANEHSIGMFQINTGTITGSKPTKCISTMNSAGISSDDIASYRSALEALEFNIDCAAEVLSNKHKAVLGYFSSNQAYCPVSACNCADFGKAKDYTEWQASARGYNGWGVTSSCTFKGNAHYVKDVNTKLTSILSGEAINFWIPEDQQVTNPPEPEPPEAELPPETVPGVPSQ